MTRLSARLPSGQRRRPCAGPALECPMGFPVHAITLDLDDTIWPIGPVIVRAENALGEWLRAKDSCLDHQPRDVSASDPAADSAIRIVW